jgi:hypothetical protein
MRKALLGALLIGGVLTISGDGWGQTARGGIFVSSPTNRDVHEHLVRRAATKSDHCLPVQE